MTERKGEVFVNEGVIIVQLRWVFVEPASKRQEHMLPADLERNRRLFSNLLRFAWRRVEKVRGVRIIEEGNVRFLAFLGPNELSVMRG